MARRFSLALFVTVTVLSALLTQACAPAPAPSGGDTSAPTATLPLGSAQSPTVASSATPSTTETAATPTAPAAPTPTSAPPTASPTAKPQPTATAVPVDTKVKPQVDKAAVASAMISAKAGGKVELKGPSGVTYTLEIPKDALLSDEMISLAAVGQIGDLPLSNGLLGAVELQPEGLRLRKLATLTIQVPAAFSAKDLIGFAYQGSGDGFHLYPVSVPASAPASGNGGAITASVIHFSGYGGGQGTEADSRAQQGRPPTNAESRFEQDMAAALEQARRSDGDPSSSSQVEDALRRFFVDQVYGDLKAAETNDQLIDAAASEYLSWQRQVELLGQSEKFAAEIQRGQASLQKGLKNAFDKASQRCTQDRDWQQGQQMIRRARDLQLLFGDSGMDMSTLTAKLKVCWTFRLDYESIVTWQLATNMDFVAHVKSQVTLRMRDDYTAFDGSGKLEYAKYQVSWRGESAPMNSLCKVTTTTKGTTLEVSPAVLSMNFSTTGGPRAATVALIPGNTTETMSLKCNTGGGSIWTNQPFPALGWRQGFGEVNKSRQLGGSPGTYVFYNLKSVGKSVVARETGTGSATVKGDKVTEEYTIDIVHTPGG